MALIFCDSFGHYSAAEVLQKWPAANNFSISTNGGRFGTNCGRMGISTFGSASMSFTFPASYQTIVCGMAFYLEDGGAANNTPLLMRLFDTGTTQVDLRLNLTTGQLIVTRNGTQIATGSRILSGATWYFIEMKAKIDNTTGSVTVKIDGVTDITFSGDTQATGNASANQFGIACSTSSSAAMAQRFGDLYVAECDSAVGLSDFVGDSRVIYLAPNGNGNSSQLAGSDGNSTDNYLLVDETSPNGDTDYVQSATTGDKDTYAFGNLAQTSGTVVGVQVLASAKKTDAGTRSIASVARLSGTEVDSSDYALTSAYKYARDVRETKPGGGAWSITDVNNAEFGVKVTA